LSDEAALYANHVAIKSVLTDKFYGFIGHFFTGLAWDILRESLETLSGKLGAFYSFFQNQAVKEWVLLHTCVYYYI